MTDLKIIPQKFSFEKPTITNANGETIQYGINVSIEINAFKADNSKLKRTQRLFLLKSLNTLISFIKKEVF